MKKLIALALALAAALTLVSCGNRNPGVNSTPNTNNPTSGSTASGKDTVDWGKSVTLHMGGGLTSSSPQYASWQEFAAAVNERSEGTITISLDLSGALGSDREVIEGVMNGSIEMMHMADGSVATVIDETGFVALPFLFPTREAAEANYFNGELGAIYREIMDRNGIIILGNIIEGDPRWISNSIREIQQPADLSGLKIRVMDNPMWIAYFTKLGCNPVAMSVSEVAAALQQKVIDGQDNGPMNTYFYGFYDFQSYMTKTNHGYAANYISINKDVFNSLSPAQQEVLTTCADEFSAKAYKEQCAAVDSLCDEMEAAGMHIVESTTELEAFLRNAAAEIWADDSITGIYNKDAMKFISENLAN